MINVVAKGGTVDNEDIKRDFAKFFKGMAKGLDKENFSRLLAVKSSDLPENGLSDFHDQYFQTTAIRIDFNFIHNQNV